MINQRGFMPAFLLPLLPYIGIALLSAALYWQIGRTAQQKEYNQTLIGVNQTQLETIARLGAQTQLNEVVLVNNQAKREVITQEVIKYRDRIKEIIREAPDGDCIVSEHSPDIAELLNASSQD